MLKYKIPQIVTLTRSNLVINPLIERQGGKLFPYIDLLNYMLKYKIPQVVTLTHDWEQFGNISDKKKKLSIELSIT